MKDGKTRIKASKSAREKFARPEERERSRNIMLKKWANGDYDGVRVGQCEWHTLTLSDGRIIKLQGTWELKYADWMDRQGISFECHRGRLPYVDDDGITRSYYPDFRLEDGTYVDVKNPLYEKLHERKLQLAAQQNGVNIKIIDKNEMKRLGLL